MRIIYTSLLRNVLIIILLAMTTSCAEKAQVFEIKTLNSDGAWCWFSDPRAIYNEGNIISGWVKKDGTIEAAALNLKSGALVSDVLYSKLEKDDHDNPAFVDLNNGAIMAFYTKHSRDSLYYNSTAPGGSLPFASPVVNDPVSDEEFERFPRRTVTYANPFRLSKENDRIYCFGRWTGFKPNVMWSDDQGETFTKSRVLIAEDGFRGGNRPYVKYFSDGESRIHMTFTDGHPRNEATNSVYYAYYEGGAFYRADGSSICTLNELPFEPEDATLVYKADSTKGRAWVYDIAADKNGQLAILYARYPSETVHKYHHALYSKGEWSDHLLCNAGKWFPETREGEIEKEPHYSGGMTLNPDNLNEIYVSRQVNGVFEIERFVTKDKGANWEITPITTNSEHNNVRPFFPRNMKKGDTPALLWMENEYYIHYTNYQSQIKYCLLDN